MRVQKYLPCSFLLRPYLYQCGIDMVFCRFLLFCKEFQQRNTYLIHLNAQHTCWGWFITKGLAAQSKAEAIGQNKISSANQRPGFQMIFFSFWSGLIYCYELCVYGSKVMIVVEYSVHEQHMNPFICPFPLEKD